MQRSVEQRADKRPTPFSILGRIGGDATLAGFAAFGFHLVAFSILGRIGGDATRKFRGGRVRRLVFQYPRSDRRRCNLSGRKCPSGPARLSVSSVGSEAMQLPGPFSVLIL